MIATDTNITELLADCRANNRKAQEALYRQYYPFAMTVAMRYARDTQEAADILSHAFVRIFRGIGSYDPEKGSLQAWIRRIVINEGLDHIKARARYSNHLELETVTEPAIQERVLEEMGAGDIMKLVRQLPPATHAVFLLFAVEGYTHPEIAKKLGISEGTSRWHLSEARKILQSQVQHRTSR